jgi:hypothetical protein
MRLSDFLKLKGSAPSVIDEAAYELIASELASDGVKQGLWTKALADAGWDESKAKSYYVKMRHEQLLNELNAIRQKRFSPENKIDVGLTMAIEEARHFGLTDDEIDYLKIPIRIDQFCKKYGKTEKFVKEAIGKKKITAVVKKEVIWVADVPI